MTKITRADLLAVGMFPLLLGVGSSDYPCCIPLDFVKPHEEQAQRNHGQTLQRLAERGGLAPDELVAVVTGRGWHQVRLSNHEAWATLWRLYAEWHARQGIRPT